MKRHITTLSVLFALSVLAGCAPTPTATEDPASFVYVQTLKGVELVAKGRPMTEGFADVIGPGVVLDSPYCVDSCAADDDWIVELELPPGSYGLRVVAPVIAGEVLGGHAVVSLAGAEKSFQAALALQVRE